LPRWAAAYEGRLPALARAAAAELAAVGLLTTDPDRPDQWLPTPGIHLWRARVRQPQPGTASDGHVLERGDAASMEPAEIPDRTENLRVPSAIDEPRTTS